MSVALGQGDGRQPDTAGCRPGLGAPHRRHVRLVHHLRADPARRRHEVSGLGVGLTAFALFGAAAAIGAGLGFLFGLPRSRYADLDASGPSNTTNAKSSETPRSAHYLTNSNLIKVSDWLTTIIIGVGLVNLAKIGPAVGGFEQHAQDRPRRC